MKTINGWTLGGCKAGLVLACVLPAFAEEPGALDALGVRDAAWVYKPASDRLYFHIWFDRPILLEAPSEGDGGNANGETPLPTRYGDGFQLFLDADDTLPANSVMFPWETVVRGVEAATYDGLPLRDALSETPSTDPTAGGWGPIKGVADYTVTNEHLSFNVPNAWVGIDPASPSLRYEVMTLQDGSVADTFIPTPTAAVAGAALLGLTLLRRKVRIER